jgi:ribonucleoside-diphosphate reductase alpha chain
VRFTEKGRALGLGVCGYHTYLQQEMLPFDSMEAHLFNFDFFSKMKEESERASKWLAQEFGEPEWCEGYGVRNTHLRAIAPTKSTALLMGGVSEGINPDPAMTFTQASAGGEIERVNPTLLNLMKKKGVYNKKNIQQVIDARGSVQEVDWLDDKEKAIFKTAFEIDQYAVVRAAATRSPLLDQWQSWNLFFAAEEDPEYISQVHKQCWIDERIRGMYYVYSKAGVTASKDCAACQ